MPKESTLTEQDIEEIIRLYGEDKKPKDLGKQFGITSKTVNQILRKNGIPPKTVRMTSSQIDDIVAQYNNGVSSEKIAKQYDVDGETIRRHLEKRGIEIRPTSRNKKQNSDGQVIKIEKQE